MADGFDFSIYKQPDNANPLAMAAGAIDLAQGVNKIKAFQQEYTARQAMGKLAQEAVGPDGQMDWDKYGMLISTHPETAWKAGEVLQQLANKKLLDAQTFGAKLKNAHDMMTAYGDAAAGLMSLGPQGVTKQAVVGKIGELYGLGLVDKDRALGMIQALPENQADLYKYVKGIAFQATQQKELMGKLLGELHTVDTGGTIQGFTFAPGVEGGAIQPQFTAGKGLSPEAKLKTITTQNPNTLQEQTGLQTEALGDPSGNPTLQGPGVAGSAGGVAPVTATPLAPPPGMEAQGGQGTPHAGLQPQPAVGGPRTVITKAGPMAEQAAKDFMDVKANLDHQVQMNDQMVNSLMEVEKAMKQGQTGGGTSIRSVLGQIAQATGIFSPEEIDKIANGSLAASQVIAKLHTTGVFDIASSLLAGKGRITQGEIDILREALLNPNMTPKAAHELIDMFKRQAGYLRTKQEMQRKWQEKGYDPAGFESYWQRHLDASGVVSYTPSGEGLGW